MVLVLKIYGRIIACFKWFCKLLLFYFQNVPPSKRFSKSLMISCLIQNYSGNYTVPETQQRWPFIIWPLESRRIWWARFSIPEVLGKILIFLTDRLGSGTGFRLVCGTLISALKTVVTLYKFHLSIECNLTDLWPCRQVFQDLLPCLDSFCQRLSFGVLTLILDRLLIIGDLFTLHDHHIISFCNIHPKFDQRCVIISL